jgi:hypothetical protein
VKCKRAQRLLPLLIGKELSLSVIEKVERHLENCSICRAEFEAVEHSTLKMREWLKQGKRDWEDSDWNEAVQNAHRSFSNKRSPLSPWPLKRSWAYVMMAGTAALLFLFVIQPSFFRSLLKNKALDLEGQVSQEIVSMRIVSEETGLKINWFFNKDFEIKEEIK